MLEDYRKLRYRNLDGSYRIITMDEFIDDLLTEERVCETQLPRLTLRKVLEETEGLPKRRSKLSKAMGLEGDDDESDGGRYNSEDEDEDADGGRYVSRSPSPAGSDGSRGGYVSRSPSRSPSRDGSPASIGYVSRSPTRSPEPAS
jgi:pre-mRNA-splicing factor 38A